MIRRLVDSNIIGIVIGDHLGGQILEANDAFLRMVGYDREDLVSGRVRWTDLTPPEWRDAGYCGIVQCDGYAAYKQLLDRAGAAL